MNEEAAKMLREPFPAEQIGKLPRITCRACSKSDGRVCEKHSKNECRICGNWITTAHLHLDYVGHAEATDRLLQVDPEWSWEPVAFSDDGAPLISKRGNDAVLWIRLTVAGTTRLGVGIVEANKFELEKQLISDALRNAAMRFGVALDLWAKSELHPEPELPEPIPVASKEDVDLFQACIEELEPEHRTEFLRWKSDQAIPWPWPQAALEAMEAKLEEIVGAGSEALPSEANRSDADGGEGEEQKAEPESLALPVSSPPAVPEDDLGRPFE